MESPFDLVFDSAGFTARVIFVGTHCGRENLLRRYPTGSLHYVRGGRAEFSLPDQAPVIVDRPSIVFFPREHAHHIRALDEKGFELVCAICGFSEGAQQSLALSFPDMVVVPTESLQPVDQVVEAFFREATSGAPGSAQIADRLCAIVLAYLVRHLCTQETGRAGLLAAAADRRIAAAVRAIHARYQTALNLATLASDAGMSRSRFVERFKRLVGTSPHHYLVNYRIGIAQDLLAKRMPVKTVAQRVGYGTTASFVRSFKQVVGIPPGAWAK